MKVSGALNSLKSLITCGKNPEKPENMHLIWHGAARGCVSSNTKQHQTTPNNTEHVKM